MPDAWFCGVQRRAARSQEGVIVTSVTIEWPEWAGVWCGCKRERRGDAAGPGDGEGGAGVRSAVGKPSCFLSGPLQ